MTTTEEKRQLLIEFAKMITEQGMYTHNDNCFTVPNGATLTSEILVDKFLSTLPDEGEKSAEEKPKFIDGFKISFMSNEWMKPGNAVMICSKDDYKVITEKYQTP